MTFETTRPRDRILCGSDTCRRAHNAKRIKPFLAARRAAKRGSAAEIFENVEVFERDGWRCAICGGRVDRRLSHPHPRSASLDHVVPITEGGAHSRANTRCSHLICNQRRGIHGGREQLSLVG